MKLLASLHIDKQQMLERGTKNMNIPETFVSQGKVLSGDLEISEGFNNLFLTIGPNLAKTYPIFHK